VTEKARLAVSWFWQFKLVGSEFRQIRTHIISRSDDDCSLVEREVVDAMLPGKASKVRYKLTVPQTDTGGQVENTKALRELG
jgi:hypothetical protein